MDDRDWQVLHILYNQKNITKTAQLLFITQPALTKRLMQIEEEFGVKIVNRGIKGVHFTPEGELLAKRAGQNHCSREGDQGRNIQYEAKRIGDPTANGC
ncbi:helix-turn-helix domain-containing protein [Brevibacillus choshinensis]|uniref:helix-turn-helix domain-containing protein n=1 Tax=Brevibacillus choshinensis TaxID=54911 RepID=UPI001EEDFE96|nr:LysR family transcriptional regulator [Brevibacillus choshinensis]